MYEQYIGKYRMTPDGEERIQELYNIKDNCEEEYIWDKHNLLRCEGEEDGSMTCGICVMEHAEIYYVISFGYDSMTVLDWFWDLDDAKELFDDHYTLAEKVIDAEGFSMLGEWLEHDVIDWTHLMEGDMIADLEKEGMTLENQWGRPARMTPDDTRTFDGKIATIMEHMPPGPLRDEIIQKIKEDADRPPMYEEPGTPTRDEATPPSPVFYSAQSRLVDYTDSEDDEAHISEDEYDEYICSEKEKCSGGDDCIGCYGE